MLKRLLRDERGEDLIEYALLVAFIAIVLIVTLDLVGPAIAAVFTKIIDELTAVIT